MEKKVTIALIAILLSTFFALAAEYSVKAASSEDDWPMLNHDPAHSGYSTSSVPINPTLLWTFPNPKITSINPEDINLLTVSPAVANGYLYITGIDSKKSLYCLNASTGDQIWSAPNVIPNSQSAPAFYEGIVYVGTADLNLILAFNASTGAQIWSANETTTGGLGSSPSVVNGVVYTEAYDALYALNASTGARIWSYPLQGYYQTPPAVAGGIVYGYDGSEFSLGQIFALNASTGQKIWNYTMGPSRPTSSPAIANGIVYIGSGDSNIYALNASTGGPLWNYTTGGKVWGTPAVAYGTVYVGSSDQNMYAFNASTGDKTWNYTVGSGVHSSPAVANEIVYISSDDRYLYAFNASTGELLWKYLTISPSDVNATYNVMVASPIIADGNIYISTSESNILAFGKDADIVYSPTPSPTVPELTLPVILSLMAITGIVAIAYLWKKQ